MRVPETNWRIVENWRLLRLNIRRQRFDITGKKILEDPRAESFTPVRTPYGAKLMRKRRAARRVAHESRRRNRV